MLRVTIRKRLRFAHGDGILEADLRVGAGDMAALEGPSGSGKTSLLRMVAGLLRPDEGRIEADGEAWFDSAAGLDLPPQRRRAGLVFQDYALFPHMTVRGNLEYALPRGADRARVDALLDAMGLANLADRRPAALSGGQKQRTALARALASAPRALLFDEPLAAVDGPMRARLQADLAALHRESGLPALLASHDPAEILRLAGRVYRLSEGRMSDAGPPAEAFGSGHAGEGLRLRGLVIAIDPEDGAPNPPAPGAGKPGARAPMAPPGKAGEAARRLSILVGTDVVRIAVPPAQADGIKPGDAVILAAAAFEPVLLRG